MCCGVFILLLLLRALVQCVSVCVCSVCVVVSYFMSLSMSARVFASKYHQFVSMVMYMCLSVLICVWLCFVASAVNFTQTPDTGTETHIETRADTDIHF